MKLKCALKIIILIITTIIFMELLLREFTHSSFDECWLRARWPPTVRPSQPTWAVNPTPPVGCYHPHPPSPFINTQPVSWHSFYRPTEGGRLSRPRHCSKSVQPVPKAVLSQWLSWYAHATTRPLRPACRYVGVNNLLKVVEVER